MLEKILIPVEVERREAYLSTKLSQSIELAITPSNFGLPPWYISVNAAINSKNYILPKLLGMDLAWCRSGIDLREKKMKIAYMETMWNERKNSWQNYIQAVLCDIFNLDQVIFEQVLTDGKRYIKNTSLYRFDRVIEQDGYVDIICLVNKAYLKSLFPE